MASIYLVSRSAIKLKMHWVKPEVGDDAPFVAYNNKGQPIGFSRRAYDVIRRCDY